MRPDHYWWDENDPQVEDFRTPDYSTGELRMRVQTVGEIGRPKKRRFKGSKAAKRASRKGKK